MAEPRAAEVGEATEVAREARAAVQVVVKAAVSMVVGMEAVDCNSATTRAIHKCVEAAASAAKEGRAAETGVRVGTAETEVRRVDLVTVVAAVDEMAAVLLAMAGRLAAFLEVMEVGNVVVAMMAKAAAVEMVVAVALETAEAVD